jgi:glutamate racemase
MPKVKVGVFDSGVGAVPVINAIRQTLPELEIIYKNDKQHLPYGERSIEEIHGFVRPIFKQFVDESCQVIVIACNTVTTNLIDDLRAEFNLPMVGMEPAIKPAAERTKTGVIAVCATPRTLSSRRYAQLKNDYAKNIKVLEPDCSDWALMVEDDRVDREKVAKIIEEVCQAGADQIVLGCTHYHWIEEEIKEVADGHAAVLQPTEPMLIRLKQALEHFA